MNKRINFFGVNIDLLNMDETIETICKSIESKNTMQHVVINVAKLVYAQKDDKLKNIINSCTLINVDGGGVILGAKMLGIDMPERVAGIDLMQNLIKKSADKGYRVYFLGAEESVIAKTIEIFKNQYPKLQIAGFRNGYFSEEEENQIAQDITDSKADILFVAFGSPKKEKFIKKHLETMQVPFVMGVGGSFDVVAGKVKRAPLWMQKTNMEWFYRVIQEPGRMWKRYFITNSLFLFMIIKEFIKRDSIKEYQ